MLAQHLLQMLMMVMRKAFFPHHHPSSRDHSPPANEDEKMPDDEDEEMLFPPDRRSTAQPTDYHKLANPWGKSQKQGASSRKAFSMRALKVNLNSRDPQSYEEALASPEKNHWQKAIEE